ncbi:carotenoid 1,2-hydratase, partial [Rhodospirillum rubrum]
SGTGGADGGLIGTVGGPGGSGGPDFARPVAPGGYAWWYVDAFSDDGAQAFTLIAFVGSVFSPYYHWAKRRDPENHVAINVALYNRRGGRWAMTERGREALVRDDSTLAIGPSALRWDGTALRITLNEISFPKPARVRGEVVIHPEVRTTVPQVLDGAGRHVWWPFAPRSRVELRMDNPDIRWNGHGYFDFNCGSEPLQDAFSRWDWSRAPLADGGAALLYEVTPRQGADRLLSLRVDRDGALSAFSPPPKAPLGATGWRVARGTRCDVGAPPTVLRTLEDTPFYARSLLSTRLAGEETRAVHESIDLDRLRAGWVWPLLPFRMPRRGG